MSSLKVRVAFEDLRTINSATFTGAYQALGGAFSHNPFLIKLVNASTVPVTVSYDGVSDQDICPSGSFYLYDEGSNASREAGLCIGIGTRVYVKGAAGVGSVYLVAQYIGG
jgi:hypothetical protein